MQASSDSSTPRFCWADLLVDDVDGAQHFYTQLLGWTTRSAPDGYTLFLRDDEVVAAVEPLGERRAAGVRPAWHVYVAVDDVDAVVSESVRHGASVREAPFSVPGFGRMAVLLDPTGAPFNLWHAEGFAGAAVMDEIGTLAWFELVGRDDTSEFYEAIFGWQAHRQEENVLFESQEQVCASARAEPSHSTSAWIPAFGVADLARAVEVALELGARPKTSHCTPLGSAVTLRDPQGVKFSLVSASAGWGQPMVRSRG